MCDVTIRNMMKISLVLCIFGQGILSANGHYLIDFHKDCPEPVLTMCPENPLQHIKHDIPTKMVPKLTVTQLHGDTVGVLSWETESIGSTSSNPLINHFILRLSLSVRGNTTDVKCLNISYPTLTKECCIKPPPDNSAEITLEVIGSPDKSCDCDIINMSPALVRKCQRSCIKVASMISTETVAIGELSCESLKNAQPEDVKMKLTVWEITPGQFKFDIYATVNNPYLRSEIFIHPDDPFQPMPVAYLKAAQDNGQIYVIIRGSFKGEAIFYAKLCPGCKEYEFHPVCYETDAIHSKPLPKVNPMPTPSYDELKKNPDRLSLWTNTHLVLGVLAGTLLTVCLVTILVWYSVKKKRFSGQSEKYQLKTVRNNTTAERVPLSPFSDTSQNCILETKLQKVDPTLVNNETYKGRSMLLYHPDSKPHLENVTDFVKYLKMQSIYIEGMPDSQFFENWRDFAEKAGEKYTDIVIVFSNGLHQLLSAYSSGDSIGGENMELWESLLQQRNQEYIPCVALTKLKYLYQQRLTSFCIHFVIFKESDQSQLDDLISKHFSFLHGNNYRVYVLPFKNLQERSVSSNNNSALLGLIQNLKNTNTV